MLRNNASLIELTLVRRRRARSPSKPDVSDAKRLKALEDVNAKLKKLLAEAELNKAMLKETASKEW
jgi:hypothetical protein